MCNKNILSYLNKYAFALLRIVRLWRVDESRIQTQAHNHLVEIQAEYHEEISIL